MSLSCQSQPKANTYWKALVKLMIFKNNHHWEQDFLGIKKAASLLL